MNLDGAIVQRVDVASTMVSLETRLPGETIQLILCATPPALFAVSSEARRREFGSARLPVPARHDRSLDGARLVAWSASLVLLALPSQGDQALYCAFRPRAPHIVRSLLSAPPQTDSREALEELRARAETALPTSIALALGASREALKRAFAKSRARLSRRIDALDGDLAKIDRVQRIATMAPWLIPEAKRAPRGSHELVATDWSTGEAKEIRFPIDPARPAMPQLEALFRRSKHMAIGRSVAARRREAAVSMVRQLDALVVRLDGELERAPVAELARIRSLADEAKLIAPRDFQWTDALQEERRTADRPRPGVRVGHRVFRSANGDTIWVGKGGTDNDVLTFKIARPHDLWLHAKDQKGAHVVVPLGRGRDVAPEALVDAAHLAAHFSDARGELAIDVQYTKRGQLRKPRGSAPGFVVVQREKVLVLRVSQERLARLLASEEV